MLACVTKRKRAGKMAEGFFRVHEGLLRGRGESKKAVEVRQCHAFTSRTVHSTVRSRRRDIVGSAVAVALSDRDRDAAKEQRRRGGETKGLHLPLMVG